MGVLDDPACALDVIAQIGHVNKPVQPGDVFVARTFLFVLSTVGFAGCAVQPSLDEPTEELLPVVEGIRREAPSWSDLAPTDPVRASSSITVYRNQTTERSVSSARESVRELTQNDPMQIHVLNIAAGNCTFVQCPNSDQVFVFDCGSLGGTSRSMRDDDVVNFFQNIVGSDEPTVVLSHPDGDHINLIDNILSTHEADSFWLGAPYENYRGSVGSILDDAVRNRTPPVIHWDDTYGSSEPELGLECGDAQTTIATVNVGDVVNEQSLVALLEFDGFRIVFPGDAHGSTEAAAIASVGDALKDIDVVLASHHGAYTRSSNHEQWISHVNPSVVIYSSGESHGHPNRDVVRRYQRAKLTPTNSHTMWSARSSRSGYRRYTSEVSEYVTELTGIITITVHDGGGYTISCERGCENAR